MTRRSHAEQDDDAVHINVVPLIDVMFFLVLFFVATSSFVRDSGMEVNRPAARSATLQNKANIVVSVTRAGETWIAGKRIDRRAIRNEIERLLGENPDSTVIVAADADGSTRLLVETLDQARLAGASNVAIATTESTTGP
jgi:biopolymer transport protein ExbD